MFRTLDKEASVRAITFGAAVKSIATWRNGFSYLRTMAGLKLGHQFSRSAAEQGEKAAGREPLANEVRCCHLARACASRIAAISAPTRGFGRRTNIAHPWLSVRVCFAPLFRR
jgi:hypothetical protein